MTYGEMLASVVAATRARSGFVLPDRLRDRSVPRRP
jgi:hypothetical protein